VGVSSIVPAVWSLLASQSTTFKPVRLLLIRLALHLAERKRLTLDLYVKKFEECLTYEQESGPNVEYQRLLPRGVVADLSMGLVTLVGPTYTKTGRHTDWHQVYLVISGSGTVKIGEKAVRVEGPTIVVIPYNTDHAVELAEGETMQYIYVNQSSNKAE
jgi:mannose-6-phosphate isomerase-like protein (cupin superfamily)